MEHLDQKSLLCLSLQGLGFRILAGNSEDLEVWVTAEIVVLVLEVKLKFPNIQRSI